MSATDLNKKAHIIKWRVILLQIFPLPWEQRERFNANIVTQLLFAGEHGREHPILYKRDQIFIILVSSRELTFQDMWCLTSTITEVEFLRSPIHFQWIHIFHCIHNSHQCRHYEIATCSIIEIIMRLEENHKFLVIKTPRSVLFFNYVTSSFASPNQNLKKIALDTEGFSESSLEVTHTLYHAATLDLQYLAQNLNAIFEEWL